VTFSHAKAAGVFPVSSSRLALYHLPSAEDYPFHGQRKKEEFGAQAIQQGQVIL